MAQTIFLCFRKCISKERGNKREIRENKETTLTLWFSHTNTETFLLSPFILHESVTDA